MSALFYLINASILLLAAFIVFRVFVRRDYHDKGRLSLFSASAALMVWK